MPQERRSIRSPNRESSRVTPPLVETCAQCTQFLVDLKSQSYLILSEPLTVEYKQSTVSPCTFHCHYIYANTLIVRLHHFVEQCPLQWGALPYFPMPRHELAHTLQPTDVLHLALSVFSAFYQLCHTELLVCSRHVGITVIVSCWVVILTTHAFD